MENKWTIDKIKEGFDQFFRENGRLPVAPEIDKLDYLPSSRQIQRRFGGLEKLRLTLGYEKTNFGRGEYRSNIASRTNKRGREEELKLEKILRDKFNEVFVHAEKIFDDSKNRVDFYIYAPEGNFGIDIFYTETLRDLQSNINIKMNKYLKFPHKLFLVVANVDFSQEELDVYARNKTKQLPDNIFIFTLETLLNFIKEKKSYPDPFLSYINYNK